MKGKALNILFAMSPFNIGGASTYVLKKARWLTERGHKPVIVHGGGNWAESLEQLPYPAYLVPQLRQRSDLLSQRDTIGALVQLARIGREQQIDLVETYSVEAAAIVEMWHQVCGLPRIVCAIGPQLRHPRFRPLVALWAQEGVLYGVDKGYLSCAGRSDLMDMAYLEDHVIPIPVDIPAQVYPDDADLRRELGLSLDAHIILAIARLVPEKRYIDGLIQDLAAIGKLDRPLALVVVGDGSDRPRLERLAAQVKPGSGLAQVVFAGYRFDLSRFYAMADIYVGMGTTALEAAAHGRPVILASPKYSDSLGYLVDQPQSIGHRDNATPERHFSELVLALLNSPEQLVQQGQMCRALAVQHYSLDAIMVRWLTIYQEMQAVERSKTSEQGWQYGPQTELARILQLLKARMAKMTWVSRLYDALR